MTRATNKAKLDSFVKHFEECFKLFPSYAKHIRGSLAVSWEINAYLQDHGFGRLTEGQERLIEQTKRDIRIYASRIEKLTMKLEVCKGKYRKFAPFKTMKAMKEFTNIFMEWFDERNEFRDAFTVAADTWVKQGEIFLAELDG